MNFKAFNPARYSNKISDRFYTVVVDDPDKNYIDPYPDLEDTLYIEYDPNAYRGAPIYSIWDGQAFMRDLKIGFVKKVLSRTLGNYTYDRLKEGKMAVSGGWIISINRDIPNENWIDYCSYWVEKNGKKRVGSLPFLMRLAGAPKEIEAGVKSALKRGDGFEWNDFVFHWRDK